MPATDQHLRPRKWGWLVLLTSATTLVCCVIPIALVMLGFGAAVAALYGNLPLLTFLGMHKEWTFVLTAAILIVAAWALFRPGRACPADPELARACESADRWNRRFFGAALAIWLVSLFAAYALLPLAIWLGYL